MARGRKYLYEAELRTRRFTRGVRNIERGSQRVLTAGARMRLAFRHFQRGNVSRAFQNIGMSIRRAGGQMAFLARTGMDGANTLFHAFGRVLRLMRRLTLVAGIAAGVIAGIGTKTVFSAAEFEKQIVFMKALGNASEGAAKQVEDVVKRLGIAFPFSVGDIAATGTEFVRRGMVGSGEEFSPKRLEALIQATSELALAADTDLATAGEAVATAVQQMMLPMEDAVEVSRMLTQTVKNTALAGGDLFEVMDGLAFVSKTAGVSFDEFLAVVGKLREAMTAGEASTSIRRLVTRLSSAQFKSPAKLEQLGLTPELAQQLSLVGSETNSLVEVFEKLSQVITPENEEALIGLFGEKTITGAARLGAIIRKDGIAPFRELQAVIRDTGKAQETTAEMMEVTANKIERVKAAFNVLEISIGQALIRTMGLRGGLDDAAAALGSLAGAIDNMSDQEFSELGTKLADTLIQSFAFAVKAWVQLMIAAAPLVARAIGIALGDVVEDVMPDLLGGLSEEEITLKKRLQRKSSDELRTMMGVLEDTATLRGFGLINPEDRETLRQSQMGTPEEQEMAREILRRRRAIDEDTASLMDRLGQIGQEFRDDIARTPLAAEVAGALRREREAAHGGQGAASGSSVGRGAAAVGEIVNHGVINQYGASSKSAKSRPKRPVGQTPQEAAQR